MPQDNTTGTLRGTWSYQDLQFASNIINRGRRPHILGEYTTIPEGSTTESIQTNGITETLKLMKKKHLNRMERDICHKPRPDFINTGRGEVCRSTSVLEVADLLEKSRV